MEIKDRVCCICKSDKDTRKIEDKIYLFGMIVGMLLISLMFFFGLPNIQLSQETGDYICNQLTNKTILTSESTNGKLICKYPEEPIRETRIIIEDPKEECLG